MDLVSTLSYKNPPDIYLHKTCPSFYLIIDRNKILSKLWCHYALLAFCPPIECRTMDGIIKKLFTLATAFQKSTRSAKPNQGAMHRFGDSLSIPGTSAIRGDPSTATFVIGGKLKTTRCLFLNEGAHYSISRTRRSKPCSFPIALLITND